MKQLSLLFITVLLVSCSGVKKSQDQIPSIGDDQDSAIQKLQELVKEDMEKRKDAQPTNTDIPKEDDVPDEIPEEVKDLLMQHEDEEESDTMPMHASVYELFNNSVIGNGKTSVIFFHAAWCSFCKKNDQRLQEFYTSSTPDISTYRVDYDTAEDLKKRYGVVQQDTFVKIDGEGNKVTEISFPKEEQLLSLIMN
jgi:thiol-disulfide isomerase/thioredoxin